MLPPRTGRLGAPRDCSFTQNSGFISHPEHRREPPAGSGKLLGVTLPQTPSERCLQAGSRGAQRKLLGDFCTKKLEILPTAQELAATPTSLAPRALPRRAPREQPRPRAGTHRVLWSCLGLHPSW